MKSMNAQKENYLVDELTQFIGRKKRYLGLRSDVMCKEMRTFPSLVGRDGALQSEGLRGLADFVGLQCEHAIARKHTDISL